MKALSALAIAAVIGAFLFAPLSFELAVSALFAAGLGAIVVSDYRRTLRRVPISGPVATPISRKERFGLAA